MVPFAGGDALLERERELETLRDGVDRACAGEGTLLTFYRKLAAAGPVSAGETDDILRQVLGVDRAGLIAGWRQYLLTALR